MSDPGSILQASFSGDNIRKVWHEGEWYYSVIDMIAELLDHDHKRAKAYWATLKMRFRATNWQYLDKITSIKLKSGNNKAYFTDSANTFVCNEIVQEIRLRTRNLKRRQYNYIDENEHLHPLVEQHLRDGGWQTHRLHYLPSGRIIDIVAHNSKTALVVECKLRLQGANFYSAVGQALCYVSEYEHPATPAIAALSRNIEPYAREYCQRLGITLIEV